MFFKHLCRLRTLHACSVQAMYRVFLGAPPAKEINSDTSLYLWRTVSSPSASSKLLPKVQSTQSFVLPRATLEAVSRRISLIYQDMVFEDDNNEECRPNDRSENEVEISVFRGVEQSTVISWPSSAERSFQKTHDGSLVAPSFLHESSFSRGNIEEKDITLITQSHYGETQALKSDSQSFNNYSDSSSIGRFPTFHFDLHTLTSLTQFTTSKLKGSVKINALLAVLEVEGPDTIRIKKGPDAGQVVSVLKLILGDDENNVARLTAWREVADDWGGNSKGLSTKRGDIIHIENITAVVSSTTAVALTASSYLKSQLVICYRTLPYSHEDGRLRPDLRLAISEPCVRKVSSMAAWFERMAGIAS